MYITNFKTFNFIFNNLNKYMLFSMDLLITVSVSVLISDLYIVEKEVRRLLSNYTYGLVDVNLISQIISFPLLMRMKTVIM